MGARLWERVSAREGFTAICLPYRVAFFAGRARSHRGGRSTASGIGSGTVGAGLCPRRLHRDLPAIPRRLLRGQRARPPAPLPQGGAGHGIWYVGAELWERVSAREGLTAICLPYRAVFFAGRGLGRPPRSHRGGGPRHLVCVSGTVGAGLCPRRLHRDLPAIPRRPLRGQRARPPAPLPQVGAGHGIWYVGAELWERVSAREGFTAVCLPYRAVLFAGRGLGRPPCSHSKGRGGPIGCLRVNIAALFILYVGCP